MKTIENKNLEIRNVANEENFVMLSRLTFEAKIEGIKYQVSAMSYTDRIRDIEIRNSETLENVVFKDERINREIYSILVDISSQLDFLTF